MKGIITETELDFLVDTGAEVSVIPSSFAKQKGFMLSSQRKILTMFDATVVSSDGIVTVPIKFQDTYVMGDFYVVDKASHRIIGFDILSRLNSKIGTQNHQVRIQNNVSESMKPETPEESKSKIATVCHIRLAKTTVVQPGHGQFIWGKIPEGQVVSGDCIVECKEEFLQRTGFLAAGVRIPTGTNPNQIPICVVNLSDNPIKLYREQVVAFSTIIPSKITVQLNTLSEQEKQKYDPVPDVQLGKDLTVNQTEQLKKLLRENNDVFDFPGNEGFTQTI